MGILAILAGLLAWHGLARVECVFVTGSWAFPSIVDVFFAHWVGAVTLVLLCMIVVGLRTIDWPAVWHWLLYMNTGGKG